MDEDATPWDEGDVLSLVSSVTTDPPFMERDQEYARMRDLLFQRRWVSIPGVTVDAYGKPRPSMTQFRSPEIEDAAHMFKNRMLAAPIKINVAAMKKSTNAEQAAQRQEDFFYRLYERWRQQGVFDPCLFDMASLGKGWVHLALNNELIPIVPNIEGDTDRFYEKLGEEIADFASGEKPDLFTCEPVDAATMYWTPDGSVVIQRSLVPMNPLSDRYGRRGVQLYMDGDNLAVTTLEPGQNWQTWRTNWSRMVEVFIVETPDYCYHVVGNGNSSGLVLGSYRNYFGRAAFFHCDGEQTGSSDPLYQTRALLNGKYQTVPVKNLLTTSLMTSGVESAQQRYTVEWIGGSGQPPDDDVNVTIIVNDDGTMVASDPRFRVVSTQLAVGADLPRALAYMDQIDTYGYPKVLGQPDEVTANSGYERARQQDEVASLLDPPLGHFAAMLRDMLAATLSAVSEIGLPLTVRSTQTKASGGRTVIVQKSATIEPGDVKDDTDINVSFNSVTLFSRIAMQEEGLKLMQADQLNETQFQQEVMGTDNIEEFREQRALDKVLRFSDDLAVQTVQETIMLLKQQVMQTAIEQNALPTVPVAPTTETMNPTNGQSSRSDRGPSIPLGPGEAMPVSPTPPGASELQSVTT